MARGTPISARSTLGDVVAALAAGLGDGNMQAFGLGVGELQNGSPVGSLDAVLALYRMKAGDDTSAGVWIPHGLGRVPRWMALWNVQLEPGQDCVAAAASIDPPKWTTSQFRVRIAAVAGNVTGVRAAFIVGG